MYTIDDIDVYVVTHNRARFIGQTLDSLIRQTIKVTNLTVLDNESTDNTDKIVKKYQKDGVKYLKTYGQYGNFFKAQELTAKNDTKFVMTFHDDDLLHPQFFEKVLLAINNYNKKISFIASSFTWFPKNIMTQNVSEKEELDLPYKYVYAEDLCNSVIEIKNGRDMTKLSLMAENPPYLPINPCICSVIYRKDLFLTREPLNGIFGKIDDYPLMIMLADQDPALLISDQAAVFHRTHRGRDGFDDKTGNNFEQSINWIKIYADHLMWYEKSYYKKLLNMLKYLYPIVTARTVFSQHPTYAFVDELCKRKIIPEKVAKKYLKKEKVEFLSLRKIEKINNKSSFWKKIFSIKIDNKQRIVINLLGLKLKIKEENNEIL